MDFMKVVDQAVREIKREVNLKVLKVPEIEQKVLDATDDEPWGPHGTALAEIAQATKKFTECQMVMNVLWTRLTETGKNWRLVYKALSVIEYLVAHGSERAVDDIIEHTFQISALSSFEYVEPNGKDVGINVRKKAENIVALLNNREKIQAVREKAAANREKYFGLSSTGITYKSGAVSYGAGNFQSSDRYGGFGNTRDGDRFTDSYRDYDRYEGRKTDEDTLGKSREGVPNENQRNTGKGSSTYGREKGDMSSTSSKPSVKISDPDVYGSVPSQSSDKYDVDDDFDDFDPRGTSSSKATSGNSNQVDLFGDSLIGDLLDAPTSGPSKTAAVNGELSNVDLFADAAFVSAAPEVEKGANPQSQPSLDLFSSQAAMPTATSSAVDLFSSADSVQQPENKAPEAEQKSQVIDPFAAIPMNSFDGSDAFGAFTSNSDSVSTESKQNTANDGSVNKSNEKALAESNPSTKKEAFQVKSGIWADSLTRGLIDLNITGPKKVSLTDIGIVGGLSDGSDERGKGPLTSYHMGMGAGSGVGQTGFNSSAAMGGGPSQTGFYSSPVMVGGLGQTGFSSSPAMGGRLGQTAFSSGPAMGRGLGQTGFNSSPAIGGGLGQTGFNSSQAMGGDDIFSNFGSQQYQYGSFKK